MIRRDEDAVLAAGLERLVDRGHDVAVDLLEGLDLRLRVAFMRRLVGRLDVDADQVHFGQRRHGAAPLGRVVGVGVAGCARHLDPLPTQQRGQPAEQIDGSDHRAGLAIEACERRQLGNPPETPEPDIRRRRLAGRSPGAVDRMVGKDFQTVVHQPVEQVAARPARIIVENRLAGQVMGGSRPGVGGEGAVRVAGSHEHQVPVTDAGKELDAAAAKLLVGGPDEQGGLFG